MRVWRKRISTRPLDDLVAALAVDENGIITHANALVLALLGYPRARLEGQHINVLIPARSRSIHDVERSNYMRDPKPRPMGPDREVYIVMGDGSESRVWIGLAPTPEGQIIAAMITAIGPPKPLNPPAGSH